MLDHGYINVEARVWENKKDKSKVSTSIHCLPNLRIKCDNNIPYFISLYKIPSDERRGSWFWH